MLVWITFTSLFSISFASVYSSDCSKVDDYSYRYHPIQSMLYKVIYQDTICEKIDHLERISDTNKCFINQNEIICESTNENKLISNDSKPKSDGGYCDSLLRKRLSYSLMIGYPFLMIIITAVLIACEHVIPIINIFLSPFVFTALVIMIDTVICSYETFSIVITCGLYVGLLLIELIVIFSMKIFERDTEKFRKLFAANSVLIELWNGKFDYDLPSILNRYNSSKPDGHVYGESYHYIASILKHPKQGSEYQAFDIEEPEHSKLLTKTTFKTNQRIKYKSWEKNTTTFPHIPSNSVLRVTIEESIRLLPNVIVAQEETLGKITSICENKDTYCSVIPKWETPYIYKNLCVIQSRLLGFLLKTRLFGFLYCLSMVLGLNLMVDFSANDDLPLKW
ncbi:Transmembrane protein [Entamoeba marina]